MTRPHIFVSQPIPEPALELMRQHAEVEVFPWDHREVSVDELHAASLRSDYFFLMHSNPIREQFLFNTRLKGIGCAVVRDDLHDVAALERSDVKVLLARHPEPPAVDPEGTYDVETGWGLNPRATSDLMVGLLLNLAYRITESDDYCRRMGFFQEMTMALMGQGCVGKTVGLYGLGRVGKQAVRKLKALDLRVVYTKRTRLSAQDEERLGVEWVEEADDLIAQSDYLCLLTNFEPANLKMFGEAQFKLMKPTAYFINVARGRLVDEDALIRALQDKTIAGAGLEVFWSEPPNNIDAYIPVELRKMDNVVLTPHNGGATYLSRGAQTMAIAKAIVAEIETCGLWD
ncbi:NAD(P)-dependent oxidoreductase [Dactylosporangium sp. NPDC005572]|uniref:NAD(P)-dependent oxidoreductase n=1 Tax=Dactylosporangium sp. NPDC005572 TaxID=3156889 RepID=UPI0033BDED94